MFGNQIRIAFRGFKNNRFFSILNIFGLATGLACCMLVSLYLYEETHYDLQHVNARDLYRVGTTFIDLNGEGVDRELDSYNTPAPLAAALKQAFAEVEKTVRTQGMLAHEKILLQSIENGAVQKAVYEPDGIFSDSSYFEMFRYSFVEGDPARALDEPNEVVISQELARKLFGDQPAYGRTLRISNEWFEQGNLDFRVSGVFRQPEAPSHLKGRFFMSMYSGGLGDYVKTATNFATNNMFNTYIRLRPGADGKALEAKMPDFVEKYMAGDLKARGRGKKQFLIPVPDVHLAVIGSPGRSKLSGSATYLYILGSIALFTLLIACVNFMNLSTARSAKRAGEVGIRKSVGATQFNLIGQFLSESVLISMISLALALLFGWLAMPYFNSITARQLSFSWSEHPGLFACFFGLALLTGLIAGIYPAFFLSSFRPAAVLKGKFSNKLSAAFLRKSLVVFQFVISAGLILASLVISGQMRYLQSTDLGFHREQQIILPMSSPAAIAVYSTLKSELARDSRIGGVGACQFYPGIMNASDGGFRREGQSMEQAVTTRRNVVDYDFLSTLGIKPVAGRLFERNFPTDTDNKIILNETAVKKYGFTSAQEAVGQQVLLRGGGQDFRFDIIGVVRDFHFESLHEAIAPFSFELNDQPPFNYLIAHANAGADMRGLLASIEDIWRRLVPGEPLDYSFLDEDFQKNYQTDRQMARLVAGFTGIAILISCLGLFGLAAFAAERRTKEIGVRKVLGASVAGITGLLARDFLKLVILAIVIASPLAWFLMQKWLEDFTYHLPLQWWMFAAAGAIALAIAFLTVSFQSLKAALANPVKSLGRE